MKMFFWYGGVALLQYFQRLLFGKVTDQIASRFLPISLFCFRATKI